MEEYREIDGYLVSNLGNVIGDTNIHTNGYYEIVNSKHAYVHVLVAKAFPEICGEWFEGCQVHHKDRNKLNNMASNLTILTKEQHALEHKEERSELGKVLFKGKHHTEEAKEKMKQGHIGKKLTQEHRKKISEGNSKRPINQYTIDGDYIDTHLNPQKAYEKTGVWATNIRECCNNKRKTAGGYVWKFRD